VIPGNDDATRAIKAYAQCIADAVIDARGANTVAGRGDEFVEVDEAKPAARPRGRKPAAPKKETRVETKRKHKLEDKDAEDKE
jgi:small subunit ribosomal protein S2